MASIVHLFGLLALALTSISVAQLASTCNPITSNVTCPPDPALNSTFFWDFAKDGASSSFSADPWWYKYFSYDNSNGLSMSLTGHGIAPILSSNFYIMYGRVDIVLKVAPGVGIVTDCILQSDDLDEIDLEWTAAREGQIQANYFSLRGRALWYGQGASFETGKNLQADFHTYSIDWNAGRINWEFDGQIWRTVTSADNDQYPRTPMRVSFGLWAGGDSDNAAGTIYWAGGTTDYTKAPFIAQIKSIKISDYSVGSQYKYSDKSGNSIEAVSGTVRSYARVPDQTSTISIFSISATSSPTSSTSGFTRITPLPTPLPVSPNGHCGPLANDTTCAGSLFGNCCSSYGFCGNTADFCLDPGCQEVYGFCGANASTILMSTPVAPTTSTSLQVPVPSSLTVSSSSQVSETPVAVTTTPSVTATTYPAPTNGPSASTSIGSQSTPAMATVSASSTTTSIPPSSSTDASSGSASSVWSLTGAVTPVTSASSTSASGTPIVITPVTDTPSTASETSISVTPVKSTATSTWTSGRLIYTSTTVISFLSTCGGLATSYSGLNPSSYATHLSTTTSLPYLATTASSAQISSTTTSTSLTSTPSVPFIPVVITTSTSQLSASSIKSTSIRLSSMPTCTIPMPKQGYHCGDFGSVGWPSVLETFNAKSKSPADCRTRCLSDHRCVSCAYSADSNTCKTFASTINGMWWRPDSSSKTCFWHRDCFVQSTGAVCAAAKGW